MQTPCAPHDPHCYGKQKPRTTTPGTGSNLTRFGNKKRVRRIHLELSHFRDQVQNLELNLKRLKLKKLSPQTNRQDAEKCSLPVWNDIAQRQLKERLRVEQKNEELRQSYAGVAQFSTELAKFWTKYDDDKHELAELMRTKRQRFWDFATEPDEEIFSEQMVLLARLCLNLQQCQIPTKTLYLNSGLSRGNVVVKRDPRVDTGVLFESHCGTTLPFSLDVALKAYWRFFQIEHGDTQYAPFNAADFPMDLFVETFSLQMNVEGLVSDISGKYTCRNYVSDNEVVIVWIEHVNVAEFGGLKFDGLQYQKRGWMKLRRVPHQGPGEQQSLSTVVECHYETVPIFRNGAFDPLQQMQAFITLVHRYHAKLDKAVCDAMGGLLLEEDWKATFVNDGVLA
ncbi:hypothetical protein PHYBOEH_003207 [Phytophthora boehmeriae]|uniref:M96 mating-specific protein family n=1 Tax=Phytophthora boehmeriae TaxID=109152 RepID=A0A8T1WP21_9STRA|nr:hypothetical protein PHYBOEH_003207 [Phytophthora boehmeriae]